MAYLTKQKQDGGRYTTIYATVATWGVLKDGRRGATQERLYVGRLDASGKTVRVSKGIVGTCNVEVQLGQLRQRVGEAGSLDSVRQWLRGLCGEAVSAAPGSTSAGATVVGLRGDVGTALVGLPHALGRIAADTGLDQCLVEAFGAAAASALLHLAMHQLAKAEPLYLAEIWLRDLWLPPVLEGFDFSSPGLSRLMDEIGRDEESRQSFYQAWMKARRHPRALVHDTTSISTYAADLEAAAFGHNRDGDRLPQENLALVCDRADGMPLFCRLVPGSVPDVVTLDLTARMLRTLGLRDTEFALDRGFYSNANLRDLLLEGHHFTIGALIGCKQSKILLAKHRAPLNSPKRSIYYEGRCLRHVRDVWTVKMGKDGRGRKREERVVEAHIFFDPRRHADRAARLDEKAFAIEHKAEGETFEDIPSARRWLRENARWLAPCLGAEKGTDGDVIVRRRPRAIAARTANASYQIVLCDTIGREDVDVLSDYRSRDRAEKLFDMLKNEDGQRRFRTGLQPVAEGRVFLAFVALAMRAELENRMRDGNLLKKISVPEFLAHMAAIRAIRLPDGTRALREVTKRQREWLEAVRIPPPEL
jgi:transposase